MPTVCTQSLVQGHMDARTHRHKEPLCMWREGTGEIKQGRGRGRGVTRTGGKMTRQQLMAVMNSAVCT